MHIRNIVLILKTYTSKFAAFLRSIIARKVNDLFAKNCIFYKTINKRHVLMESRNISGWRAKYLKEIYNVRSRHISR